MGLILHHQRLEIMRERREGREGIHREEPPQTKSISEIIHYY
jgi:hypothetical protein